MNSEISSNFDGKDYSEDKVRDILFNKILAPKIEFFNSVISNEFYNEYVKELWEKRNQIYHDDIKYDNRIDNISVMLNNKIIQISNYFKAHNMPFYENFSKTSLARVVICDLFSYYNSGIDFFKNSYVITKKANDLPDEFENTDQAVEFYNDIMIFLNDLTKYQAISNKLWDYNFENYIFSSIMNEYYKCTDKSNYKQKLDIYIKELKQMGLEQQANELENYFNKLTQNGFRKSREEKTNKSSDETDNKENELFSYYQTKITETRNLINNSKIKDKKILNVGTLLNNKVVESVHLFKKKGKDFYDFSTLEKMVLTILEDYYKKAYMALKNNSIDEYKEYCSKIYDFSIEKNVVPYFEVEPNDEWNEKYKKRYYSCKEELVSMGYMEKEEER